MKKFEGFRGQFHIAMKHSYLLVFIRQEYRVQLYHHCVNISG
jgi:hypothetical protein